MRLFLIFRSRGRFFGAGALAPAKEAPEGGLVAGDLPIRRIGDITILFHAFPALEEAIANQIDFSFLKDAVLCEQSLYQGFFCPLIRYITQKSLLRTDEKGTISTLDCEALFISGEVAYVFDSQGFHPVADYAAIGDQRDLAVASLLGIYNGFDPQKDVNQALLETGRLCNKPVLPLVIPDFENGTYDLYRSETDYETYSIPFLADAPEESEPKNDGLKA